MPDVFLGSPTDFDAGNPLRDDARVVTGRTRGGKVCRLVDNSGDALPEAELREILQRLVEAKLFGFRSLSAAGADAISLDRRECAHVQIGGRLYRLILYRYEARIEPF